MSGRIGSGLPLSSKRPLRGPSASATGRGMQGMQGMQRMQGMMEGYNHLRGPSASAPMKAATPERAWTCAA